MSKITTRVLLVEDEEDAREILEFYLDTVFDEVEVACDGVQGVEKYQHAIELQQTFDVIVTDIKMPNKNGLEMIEEITQLNEEQKFIIVSAHKDEEYLFRSINLNVMSYFVKPLEVKNIMEILKKVKNKVLEDKSANPSSAKIIQINRTYQFNVQTQLLSSKEGSVDLSKKEVLLLTALLEDIHVIKTKEDLKKSIWNDTTTSDATLRTVIKRLKDKIIDDDFIVSKKGRGYIIE